MTQREMRLPNIRGLPGRISGPAFEAKVVFLGDEAVPLLIQEIRGAFPTQGYGTIGGVPFYYRSRWGHWSFDVGAEPIMTPEWCRDGEGGEEDQDAEQIIRRCAEEYVAEMKA